MVKPLLILIPTVRRAWCAIGHWAIKGGDAQQGALKVYWDGQSKPPFLLPWLTAALNRSCRGDMQQN